MRAFCHYDASYAPNSTTTQICCVLTLKNENSQQLHKIPYLRRGRKNFEGPRNRRNSLNILPTIGTLGLQRFWKEQPRARKSTKLRTIQKSQIFG